MWSSTGFPNALEPAFLGDNVFRRGFWPLMFKQILSLALICSVFSVAPLAVSEVIAEDSPSMCATPGTAAFASFPTKLSEVPPSIRRQLSGYGRLAKAGNCSVVIVCAVEKGAGADGKKVRDAQCSVARDALSRYERRTGARKAITKGYKLVKQVASPSVAAGTVYITLQ